MIIYIDKVSGAEVLSDALPIEKIEENIFKATGTFIAPYLEDEDAKPPKREKILDVAMCFKYQRVVMTQEHFLQKLRAYLDDLSQTNDTLDIELIMSYHTDTVLQDTENITSYHVPHSSLVIPCQRGSMSDEVYLYYVAKGLREERF
jgi:hypothetical protein